MKILVIAAHPDDEVLGCGGTIRRLANEGHAVHISILGEGITSRYSQPDEADQILIQQLHARSQTVADLLGATELSMFSLPDNRFDTVALLDIAKIIEGLIDKVQPSVVYTQHGGDLNVDHVATFRATLTATRPTPSCPVKAVYSYQVASSSEWSFQQFAPVFRPSVFMDISATLETKVEAMQQYESEARAFPHPRSPEALRAAAQHYGSMVGIAAAEAFQCVRDIR